MPWLLRAAISALAASFVSVAFVFALDTLEGNPVWDRSLVYFGLVFSWSVPCFVAVTVYSAIFRRKADAETRCRRCSYILRGISEPRCPECGERI